MAVIVEATAGHWPQIFPIFRAIVAAGETYAYPDDLTSDEAKALWMPGPPSRTVVWTDADQVMGTALMGPNRPGRGSHVATAGFMVDPSNSGTVPGAFRSATHGFVGLHVMYLDLAAQPRADERSDT